MAAPFSKPSPTSQPVHQSSETESAKKTDPVPVKNNENVNNAADNQAANPEDGTEVTTKEIVVETEQPIPSYENSEQSESYKVAKTLLDSGDFEQVLSTIELAIETTKALLLATCPEGEIELHESLAPFHYLYGTTLLYSIEESTDSQAMTVGNDDEGQTAAAKPDTDEDAPSAEQAAANADDMEIAWENLEAARAIVETMLTTNPSTKLRKDMAQILLREGDLQRMNGNYVNAIQDYKSCLELHKATSESPYSRKFADVHYNLGLSYLYQSSSQTAEGTETSATKNNDNDAKNRADRDHGIYHYVECAKSLCGTIAHLCGAKPSDVVSGALSYSSLSNKEKAGLKTTGLDVEQTKEVITPRDASEMIRKLRQGVADLTPKSAGDPVEDMKQFLIELQETVDEAESSQDAIRQAAELKAQAKQQVDAVATAESSTGATTTIGFGKPKLSTDKVSVATTAESTTTTNTTSANSSTAKPMMVIKKKKKRPATEDTNDSKLSAESTDAKRAKSE